MSNTKKRPNRSSRSRPAAKPESQKSSSRTWLLVGGVVVVVGLLVWVVMSGVQPQGPSGVPAETRLVPTADPAHVEGQIDYGVLVPAGGPHNPIWLNCGFYPNPVRPENAVHALEHAAVWVTYRSGANDTTVDTLRSLAGRRSKLIVSPIPGQDSLLMATAWGYQLKLDSVDDPRLQQFLNEFEATIGYAPEPGGICFGGVGNPE